MKKVIFLLMFVLVGTTLSMAQNRGGQRQLDPEEMAKKQTQTLKTELALNEDQAEKMEKVLFSSYKEMSELRQEMRQTENRSGMREQMTSLRAKQEKEIKKILSEEQFKKYKKMMEERRERRGEGPGSRDRR